MFRVSREGEVNKGRGLLRLQQAGNKVKTETALGWSPRDRWTGRGPKNWAQGVEVGEATWCSLVSSQKGGLGGMKKGRARS